MRIGIDARPLQGETQYRGIGKALYNTINALSDLDLDHIKFILYVDSGLPLPENIKLPKSATYKYIPTSKIGRLKYIRVIIPPYRKIRPSANDIDVLLQYDFALGIPEHIPTVAMFHDLIPVLFKDYEKQNSEESLIGKLKYVTGKYLHWRRYLTRLKAYQKATRIVAISERSKHDLMNYMPNLNTDNIHVGYLGVSDLVDVDNQNISDSINKLSKHRYLLYVGGIDVRKNVVGLLRDFYELKADWPDLKLVMVGKEFELKRNLQDLGWYDVLKTNEGYAKDIIMPGFISDAEVRLLYRNASAFIFPSRYEGFGLPVLEAMQMSCPVVAYNNSSIPEVAGKAALLVEDGESMVGAISSLLDDRKLRTRLIANGKLRAKQFTWKNTAHTLLNVLLEASKKPPEH